MYQIVTFLKFLKMIMIKSLFVFTCLKKYSYNLKRQNMLIFNSFYNTSYSNCFYTCWSMNNYTFILHSFACCQVQLHGVAVNDLYYCICNS